MEIIQKILPQSEIQKVIPILTDHQKLLLTKLNDYLNTKSDIYSDTLENQEKFIKNIINNDKTPIPKNYFAYSYMFENIRDLFQVIEANKKIKQKNDNLEKIKIFLTKQKYGTMEEEMSVLDRGHSILFGFLYFKNHKPFYKDSFVMYNDDIPDKDEIIKICYNNGVLVDSGGNKIK